VSGWRVHPAQIHRHKPRARRDLPANLRIPRIAADEFVLVELHLDATRAQRLGHAGHGCGKRGQAVRCSERQTRAGPLCRQASRTSNGMTPLTPSRRLTGKSIVRAGGGAIQVPDVPRFQRCADAKSGGTGGIIRDSRHDPLPTAPNLRWNEVRITQDL